MKNDRKVLAARDIWRTAFATLGATRAQSLALLGGGMILPQVALSLWLDVYCGSVVSELRAAFTAKGGAAESFTQLLAPSLSAVSLITVLMLLFFLGFSASYLALVQTMVDHHRGLPPRGAGRSWLIGLRRAVPGGVVLVVAVSGLMLVGQVLVAPAILAGVLGLVVPIVYVAESRGALRSLWTALTLKYTKGSRYSGWAVMFNLLSLGALLYAGLAGEGLLCELLLEADERFGWRRTLWSLTLPHSSFGPVYLGVSLLESCLTMTLVALVPALTAALYFMVVAPRPLAQA